MESLCDCVSGVCYAQDTRPCEDKLGDNASESHAALIWPSSVVVGEVDHAHGPLMYALHSTPRRTLLIPASSCVASLRARCFFLARATPSANTTLNPSSRAPPILPFPRHADAILDMDGAST